MFSWKSDPPVSSSPHLTGSTGYFPPCLMRLRHAAHIDYWWNDPMGGLVTSLPEVFSLMFCSHVGLRLDVPSVRTGPQWNQIPLHWQKWFILVAGIDQHSVQKLPAKRNKSIIWDMRQEVPRQAGHQPEPQGNPQQQATSQNHSNNSEIETTGQYHSPNQG